jgi:hypothetical protein
LFSSSHYLQEDSHGRYAIDCQQFHQPAHGGADFRALVASADSNLRLAQATYDFINKVWKDEKPRRPASWIFSSIV